MPNRGQATYDGKPHTCIILVTRQRLHKLTYIQRPHVCCNDLAHFGTTQAANISETFGSEITGHRLQEHFVPFSTTSTKNNRQGVGRVRHDGLATESRAEGSLAKEGYSQTANETTVDMCRFTTEFMIHTSGTAS
jgi:hypothetical protein